MTDPAWTWVFLGASAFLAGAMNSIAGGGTLLTFPALMGVLPPAMANATSTVALLPGSLAGAWGYRAELASVRDTATMLLPASLLGGLLGAGLLVAYPDAFGALVPWLILTAAILFLVQPLVSKALKRNPHRVVSPAFVVAFQFGVAVYGGYFGAGIGILMLAALGFLAIGNIHQMNAVKTLLAAAINAVSVVLFIAADLVEWKYALAMAAAAIAGGYAGARVARRLPAKVVRWVVVAVGFGLAAYYFVSAL